MYTNSLLIELFTEELPPKALQKIADYFAHNIYNELSAHKLTINELTSSYYSVYNHDALATPRRIAVKVTNVLEQALDTNQNIKLMPASVGIINGIYTLALIKKLKSLNLDENIELNIINDGKQDYLSVNYTAKGVSLTEKINEILQKSIQNLPIPTTMSYQLKNGETVNFVRPAHSLLCLYGNKVIKANILGLESNNITYGHRFLSNQQPITIPNVDAYENALENAFVIPNYNTRLKLIKKQLDEKAQEVFAHPIYTDELLHEINSLVEYPQVYIGEFEEKFLQIPHECLILTMQSHQKYIALQNSNKELINKFLFVSNMPIDNPINIIEGNEKVIRPRLSDAEFFFNEDKKHSLNSRINDLDKVVYHNKLGSQKSRLDRVSQIIEIICDDESNNIFNNIKQKTLDACAICKSDLLTNMIGEFPELQGIIGKYYALHDGYDIDVADAIAEHYKPKFSGDSIPNKDSSCLLALADKLETLVGMWGIGLKPTGEKDQYALRRHALGILRILTEKNYNINFKNILLKVSNIFNKFDTYQANIEEVYNFCIERLINYLKEQNRNSYNINIIDAVLYKIKYSGNLYRLNEYLDKFTSIFNNIENKQSLDNLVALNKRIDNILKKQQLEYQEVKPELFIEEAEKNLYVALYNIKLNVESDYAINNLIGAFDKLNTLVTPLSNFFDDVMVNAENESIRNNRLSLLYEIYMLLNVCATLSRI